MLPLSVEVNVLNKERKKESYSEVAKIYGKNESSICELLKKKKEICTNFAVVPQTAKLQPHCMRNA